VGVGLGLVAGGAVGRWRGATDQVGFEDEAWRPGEGEGVAGAVYKETGAGKWGRARLMFFLPYSHFLNNTSRLPVRCDGLQQYPRKLFIKRISRFFIDCLRSLYNIFFDLAN
jgi:hypothetical protein